MVKDYKCMEMILEQRENLQIEGQNRKKEREWVN